jgi:hypothetical protein
MKEQLKTPKMPSMCIKCSLTPVGALKGCQEMRKLYALIRHFMEMLGDLSTTGMQGMFSQLFV